MADMEAQFAMREMVPSELMIIGPRWSNFTLLLASSDGWLDGAGSPNGIDGPSPDVVPAAAFVEAGACDGAASASNGEVDSAVSAIAVG
jgi:hypothetical protein